MLQHFAYLLVHRAAYGLTQFCLGTEKICSMNKMTIKHGHLQMHTGNRPPYISLAYTINPTETPWSFNYSARSPCSP